MITDVYTIIVILHLCMMTFPTAEIIKLGVSRFATQRPGWLKVSPGGGPLLKTAVEHGHSQFDDLFLKDGDQQTPTRGIHWV